MRWFKNLKPLIRILVLSGVLLVLLTLYIPLSNYTKPAITSLLSFSLKFCEGLSSNAKQFLGFQDLVQENSKLKAKINKLNAQLSQLQEAAQENGRLRKLLSLPQKKSLCTEAALVIGKDSSNWTTLVIINKGTLRGVKKDMPVTLGNALVGKVVESAPNVSKVALPIDFNSKIPAKILSTREEGLVFGTFAGGRNICKIKYIQEVKVGDEIISSGLGRIYPKGFLIGTVIAVEEEKDRLYKIAEIQPAVNFSTMEEVTVITDY